MKPIAECMGIDPKLLTPVTMMLPLRIHGKPNTRLLRVLLDSGGSSTIINRRILPKGCVPMTCKTFSTKTAAGPFTMNQRLTMKDITLPEFNTNVNIETLNVYVFNQPDCAYDVICGRDLLSLAGVVLDFEQHIIRSQDKEVPMKPPGFWDDHMSMYLSLEQIFENDEFEQLRNESFADILPSKYERVKPEDVPLNHLNETMSKEIRDTIYNYPELFSGFVGKYKGKKIHIDVDEKAVPHHSRPYAVPRVHYDVYKGELERLVNIGVLERTGGSRWASPSFITQKKDGRVRWVSDLRKLNESIIRKKYPLPRIGDILSRRKGYKYFTKIDISMQYWAFELDEESQELCTIITPFGKFKYKRLPMGASCSSDIAQEIMEKVLFGLEEVEIFIDDIGIFSDDWESHLKSINVVLKKLEDAGFTVNPLKCEWAVQETDWLGYWLTPVASQAR